MWIVIRTEYADPYQRHMADNFVDTVTVICKTKEELEFQQNETIRVNNGEVGGLESAQEQVIEVTQVSTLFEYFTVDKVLEEFPDIKPLVDDFYHKVQRHFNNGEED